MTLNLHSNKGFSRTLLRGRPLQEIVHEMWQRCLDNGDIYKLFGVSFGKAVSFVFLHWNLAIAPMSDLGDL